MSRVVLGKKGRTSGRLRATTPEQEAERLHALAEHSGELADLRAAAEAWRMVDRPLRSMAILARLGKSGGATSLDQALLAGTLQDLGELEASRAAARDSTSSAQSDTERVIAWDVAIGAALLAGDFEMAREGLRKLQSLALPMAQLSAAFREARLLRYDGLLDEAVARLHTVLGWLSASEPRLAVTRALALHESANIELLRGNLDEAQVQVDAAIETYERAQRRPGRFLAEGLRVRIALARGEIVLPSTLDNPVAFADERSLKVLGAELRIDRGLAGAAAGRRGAAEDFDAAVAWSRDAGARQLEGVARLRRREAGIAAGPDDLLRTRSLLAEDRVLSKHPALRSR